MIRKTKKDAVSLDIGKAEASLGQIHDKCTVIARLMDAEVTFNILTLALTLALTPKPIDHGIGSIT